MIKDMRYIIKRVIIGVLICLILSFIRTCEVKANTSIQSIELNYDQTISTAVPQVTIYSRTSNYQLVDYGRGVLQFQVAFYKFDANGVSNWNQNLTGIYVRSGNNLYTCNVGTLSNESFGSENYKYNIYSALCNVNLGSTGLNEIVLELNNSTNGYTIKTSNFMSFIGDVDIDVLSRLDIINSTLVTYITSLYNAQVNGNNYLASIENIVNTDLTAIIRILSSNTQAIIDNQDENTEQTIESQQVCNVYDKNAIEIDGSALNYANGNVFNNTYFGITKYIKLNKNSELKIINSPNNIAAGMCFYDINKTYISCLDLTTLTIGQNITIPTNASYVRSTIYKNQDRPQFEVCNNGNQALNETQEETNNLISSDDVSDPDDSINSMASQIATNSVISDLLLLPITLFTNVLNAVNGSCSTFSLGNLYGTNLSFPCINLQNILGSTLYGVIDILLCGIFVLSMRKKFVDIFQDITSLKDGGNQLE